MLTLFLLQVSSRIIVVWFVSKMIGAVLKRLHVTPFESFFHEPGLVTDLHLNGLDISRQIRVLVRMM